MNSYGFNSDVDLSTMDGLDDSILNSISSKSNFCGDNNNYSNMINENLLDGLTENTSLLSADGEDEEVSNAFGDWFKRVFKRTPSADELYKDASTLKLADPKVDIVEAAEMEKVYKESGSKKPFREWVKSDSAKNILSIAAQVAGLLIKGKEQAAADTTKDTKDDTKSGGESGSTDDNKDDETKETKILGMSPVVFGIVALGAVIVTSVVAVKIFKNK